MWRSLWRTGRYIWATPCKGLAGLSPLKWRDWIRKHPIYVALLLGLVLAAMGTYSEGQTYGTGYNVVARALEGQLVSPEVGILKLFATVTTYWNGIAGGILRHPSLPVQALAPCYGKSAMAWLINVSSSFYVWRPF